MSSDTENGPNEAGEHCVNKVLTSTMYGSAAGLFLGGSIYASEFVLHEAAFKTFGFRVVANTTGLVGTASAVFAATSCISAGIREKDDHVNAMVGGACAGLVFGLRKNAYRPSTGLLMAGLLAVLSGLSKARYGTYIPPLQVVPGKYMYDYSKLDK